MSRITVKNVEGIFATFVRSLPPGTIPDGEELILDPNGGWAVYRRRKDGTGGYGTPFGDARLNNTEMYHALLYAMRTVEMLTRGQGS